MSKRERTTESLGDEAARWRRSYREAQAVVEEQNRLMLELWFRGRLADPSDFDVWIGIDAVTDAVGRINWDRLELLVDELLVNKPHLAAPDQHPWRDGTRAVDWFSNGAQ